MTWTPAGQYALNVVWNLARPDLCQYDIFGGFSYGLFYQNGARIGFEQRIIDHIYNNAPRDNREPAWFTCAYCNWEYPRNRCQIDHVIPWEAYSQRMTEITPLFNALALQVWVGCNDPANLVVACDSCNASKGNRPLTALWQANRRRLADQNDGF